MTPKSSIRYVRSMKKTVELLKNSHKMSSEAVSRFRFALVLNGVWFLMAIRPPRKDQYMRTISILVMMQLVETRPTKRKVTCSILDGVIGIFH